MTLSLSGVSVVAIVPPQEFQWVFDPHNRRLAAMPPRFVARFLGHRSVHDRSWQIAEQVACSLVGSGAQGAEVLPRGPRPGRIPLMLVGTRRER